MSENNTEEQKQEVVLDQKDSEVIERFFTHFEITMPDYLKDAIAQFGKEQTYQAQNNLKLCLTKAIGDCKEDFLGIDEIFEPVILACDETAYNLQFDKDLQEELSKND